MPELDSIALRVRSLRDQKKISNRKFAEILGVSSTMLLDIEKGKRDINLKVLEALKREFRVSADWVLFGEEPGKADDLNTLLDNFVKSKELNTILHVYLNTWIKQVIFHTAKEQHYECADFLKEDALVANKTISRIDRLIDAILIGIADYTVKPDPDLATILKSNIRDYFKIMYEFIDLLQSIGNISTPISDPKSDWVSDLIFKIGDNFQEINADIERKTNELLNNRKKAN